MQGVSRTFEVGGRPVRALDDVNLHIRHGDYIAIMGPSGSGKSTLLNLIGCLDRPTRGSYHLDGRQVASLDEAELTRVRRHMIGFVFQFFHLINRLTAAGNVELPMIFAGIARSERRRRVAEALAQVGLSDRADHRPQQLSGGERQRVALARATVMGPRILLADEPTGNLDQKSGQQILELIEKLNEDGLTLVVVTHDPNVARRANRILVLIDGKVAQEVPGEEIAEVVATLLAAAPAESAEPPADSVADSATNSATAPE